MKDSVLFTSIIPADYIKLWETGKVNIFPESYIASTLNEKYQNRNQVGRHICGGQFTLDVPGAASGPARGAHRQTFHLLHAFRHPRHQHLCTCAPGQEKDPLPRGHEL